MKNETLINKIRTPGNVICHPGTDNVIQIDLNYIAEMVTEAEMAEMLASIETNKGQGLAREGSHNWHVALALILAGADTRLVDRDGVNADGQWVSTLTLEEDYAIVPTRAVEWRRTENIRDLLTA